MLVAFPAIFTPEDSGGYLIKFPDVPSAFTGINEDNVALGIKMAEEVLGLMLADMVENVNDLPEPSPIDRLEAPVRGFVTLVKVDLEEYFKDMTPVKKTLTIPAWANELGLRSGINFSQILTKAIADNVLMKRET